MLLSSLTGLEYSLCDCFPSVKTLGDCQQTQRLNANWREPPAFHSLRSDRSLARSQDVFLDLAGRSFGEFFDKGHTVWCLEMREVRSRKLAELAFIGARPLLENDECVRRFAPAFMREPDDRNLLHGRVAQKHSLDFDRGDVFPAADDDVFQSVANLDIAIGM